MTDAAPKLLRGLLEVFILESLEREPKHGYALLKQLGETFGAEPNRNRLYPLLGRMVAEGLLREVGEPGGNRTLYALTEQGLDALHSYRKLPAPFRQALRRIWAHDAVAGPSTASPSAPQPAAPVLRNLADGALPYPCPDARIAVERAPGGSEITLKLTGCPMGAYEYCPRCPVFQALEPARRLLF